MSFANDKFIPCEQVIPSIVLYIDHEIFDEQELNAVESHFGSCPGCRTQMEQELSALELMRNLLCTALNEPAPDDLNDRIHQQTEDLYKIMIESTGAQTLTEITYTQTTYTEFTSDGTTQIEITSEIRRSSRKSNCLITNLVIMKPEQVIGVVGMSTMAIRPGDTSVAQGVNDLPVVGSNQILSLMESACSASIIEFLDFGETTVTFNSQIEILGAAGVGSEIHATARCLGLAENILKFEVEVHQSSRLIATGLITRKFVERVSFMARVAAETMVAEKESNIREEKIASSLRI